MRCTVSGRPAANDERAPVPTDERRPDGDAAERTRRQAERRNPDDLPGHISELQASARVPIAISLLDASRVLAALHARADDDDLVFPTLEELRSDAGVSARVARRALVQLATSGVIERVRGETAPCFRLTKRRTPPARVREATL